jgi:hypothetical protein
VAQRERVERVAARLVARELPLVDQQHVAPELGEARRAHRAAGTGADDQHLGLVEHRRLLDGRHRSASTAARASE